MSDNWKSDKDLKKKSSEFFKLARESVITDSEKRSEAFKQGRFRFLKGVMFDVGDDIREAQRQLVIRCSRLLGAKTGNEKEISELAWEQVWQSLAGNDVTDNIGKITGDFIRKLTEHSKCNFGYVVSNYVIQFREQVKRLLIGPVEAVTSEVWIDIIKQKKPNLKCDFTIGESYDFSISGPGMVIQLPPICWSVSVNAAKGNVEEEASWLVDVALSFLRLSYPDERYDFFPSLGDVEAMPFTKSMAGNQGITLSENGISAGGSSRPHIYVIDDRVLEVVNGEQFKARAEAIFSPGKNSLAKRVGQGLGWLTRGRQASDRAERFLFFFTAIESLLSSDDKSAPVVQTIARYTSAILHDEPDKRIQTSKDIKSLYSVRSKLVHAGERDVLKSQANSAQLIAEELYARVLDRFDLNESFQSFQDSLDRASYGLKWPIEN